MDVAQFDVLLGPVVAQPARGLGRELQQGLDRSRRLRARTQLQQLAEQRQRDDHRRGLEVHADAAVLVERIGEDRSEEHTSELQSLMRISYAVFCLKKTQKTIRL